MTTIICVGDIHAMDRPPVNATESYMDDIIAILEHVAKLERDLNADAVVWAGDVFHHKQPSRTSHATVLRMIEVVKKYRNLYAVVGNHDCSMDVVDSVSEKQPLGVLFEAGLKELNGWHESLPLFGVPWQQRWHNENTPMEAFASWREDSELLSERALSLAVTHAPIYPPATRDEQMFELVPTAGPHGLSEAMGHQGYLYYGHIHEDHGIFEDEGVTYANMGAVSRGSLTEYNLNREIKVALWTDQAYQGVSKLLGDFSFEMGFNQIPVPHKPASEVFRIAEATEAKESKLSLDQFLSEVGSSTLDISSTASVIDHIKALDVDVPVKQKAIELLERVG